MFWRHLTLIYGNAASMVDKISCNTELANTSIQQLQSDTVIEVAIHIPFAFRPIPVQAIESTGTQVLDQLLKIMLPRFLAQLLKDYQAWASGDIQGSLLEPVKFNHQLISDERGKIELIPDLPFIPSFFFCGLFPKLFHCIAF